MAEAFSYFTYNNNLEQSFLSSLSQMLQENQSNEHEIELIEDSAESVNSDNESRNEEERGSHNEEEEERGSQNEEREFRNDEEKDSVFQNEEEESGSHHSNSSHENQGEEELQDEHVFVQLSNPNTMANLLKRQTQSLQQEVKSMLPKKKQTSKSDPRKKSAKVVPLLIQPQIRRVQFYEQKADVSSDDAAASESESDAASSTTASIASIASNASVDENIKEVDIPESNNTNELEALVKQLVLLEKEGVKAQEFLHFIQQHSCFDKQDYKAVRHFVDMIEQEKNTLIVVLSNYNPQVQQLITMMTIAERRLSLLDSTPLITPGSTLHTSFLEKQRSLQDVIDQATAHVFGSV